MFFLFLLLVIGNQRSVLSVVIKMSMRQAEAILKKHIRADSKWKIKIWLASSRLPSQVPYWTVMLINAKVVGLNDRQVVAVYRGNRSVEYFNSGRTPARDFGLPEVYQTARDTSHYLQDRPRGPATGMLYALLYLLCRVRGVPVKKFREFFKPPKSCRFIRGYPDLVMISFAKVLDIPITMEMGIDLNLGLMEGHGTDVDRRRNAISRALMENPVIIPRERGRPLGSQEPQDGAQRAAKCREKKRRLLSSEEPQEGDCSGVRS